MEKIYLVNIFVILYFLYRVYKNYKSGYKNHIELSLIIGAVVAWLGNQFFPESFVALVLQLVFLGMLSRYFYKSNYVK